MNTTGVIKSEQICSTCEYHYLHHCKAGACGSCKQHDCSGKGSHSSQCKCSQTKDGEICFAYQKRC